MNSKKLIKVSKFLSLVLRHKPETVGLTLSEQGWISIDDLLQALESHGRGISRETLSEIVETNDKQRFAISPDGLRIRANQGHTVQVDLGLEPQTPPSTLYHGTATRFLGSIQTQGLKKMQRSYVHLSANRDTATRVGRRHGKLALLIVEAAKMAEDGYQFYLSTNGVWLTDAVPASYLREC